MANATVVFYVYGFHIIFSSTAVEGKVSEKNGFTSLT